MTTKKLKIIVVGMGNIGKRHIESISKLPYSVNLFIVDTEIENPYSMEFLGSLILENDIEINTYRNLNDIHENFDIAIIATNSLPRLKLLKQLLANCKIRFIILEKFLFPTVGEYQEAKELIFESQSDIYVNCGRREWNSYKEIREIFIKDKRINIEVSGGDWNLGSNVIHFIDLFHYFLGFDKIKVEIIEDSIKLIESKRSGYTNFFGEIKVIDNNKNILSLNANESLDKGIQYIKLVSENNVCTIFERKGFYILNGETHKFTLENVSDLTAKIISDLCTKNKCNLIDMDQSMELHLAFLTSFIKSQKLKEGILT